VSHVKVSVYFYEASELVSEVAVLTESAVLFAVELTTVLCLELLVYTSSVLGNVEANELLKCMGELAVFPAYAVAST
jgi:hypothetical protein